MDEPWRLYIDTGGTFTDCLALSPEGAWRRAKVLSSGELSPGTSKPLEAPLLAAHVVTRTPLGAPLPPLTMRLGTTRGTNALLTRMGTPPVLFLTEGLEDLLRIGDQSRPNLFALHVQQPAPLFCETIGVRERLGADGAVLRALDEKRLRAQARAARERGASVAAVALLHSWKNDSHERRVGEILREEGFSHVSLSATLSPLQRLLPRARTAVVDAYLAPTLTRFLDAVAGEARSLSVMTSAGGLTPWARFRPCDSLLSGPAGGVVGAHAAGRAAGVSERFLAFDMGGTSTDVCLIERESGAALVFEHGVGDVRLLAPAVAVETIAAGGGSVCDLDAQGRLRVGPASAGASPGPACYGQGGPLTLTDVNLLLGRIDPARFAFPLDLAAAQARAAALAERVGSDIPALLHGLLALADEAMAAAVRRISTARGIDPAGCTLLVYGGAGGQHACAVAERLGVRRLLVPVDQSLLSARGLACAALTRIAERQVLFPLKEADVRALFAALEAEAQEALPGSVVARRIARLRLQGQETPLDIEAPREELHAAFVERFSQLYGYPPDPQKTVELESLRVLVRREDAPPPFDIPESRRAISPQDGPALLVEDGSSTFVAAGWRVEALPCGALQLQRTEDVALNDPEVAREELFTRRFESIATEMGETLRRTALSVNVKERLDYSCALLAPDGALVATAAHIPVHLGALGVCVRTLLQTGFLQTPETLVVNHPAFGGSHLPDITLVTPVFDDREALLGFVASRAHHAELGGTRPGSMPPGATRLIEEGVVIPPTPFDREKLAALLTAAPFPTRALADNLADLDAQLAANRQGAHALRVLARTHGAETLVKMRTALSERCACIAAEALAPLVGVWSATERLDDGSRISVEVSVSPEGETRFDFTGTAAQHPSNFNAPPAVVEASVLYVLRLLVGADVPLNDGLLAGITLTLPEGSLLSPRFESDPARCPAVVAGNTEVSQRVVQVLLRALKLCAGSQATMNNVLLGDGSFGYYETVCGGGGASVLGPGASGVHTHMTNTRITDPEVLESRYPVRLEKFGLRHGSGGRGQHPGGEGVIRELRFLRPLSLSLLCQSRGRNAPFGLAGGRAGQPGRQRLLRRDGTVEELLGVSAAEVGVGDRLRLETPGGGGWGHG